MLRAFLTSCDGAKHTCRGAGKSQGRTSWSATPEQQDYASFVGLLVYYLHHLRIESGEYPPSPGLSSPGSSHLLSPVPSASPSPPQAGVILILGGYSYGSLVASHLPPISEILAPFSRPEEGSTAAEIRRRALHLADAWNDEHRARRRHAHASALHGGECEPGSRRSRELSRRSVEFLRRSMDRSREKLGLSPRRTAVTAAETLREVGLPSLRLAFLLVSPLLPPVSSLLSMFARHGLLHRSSNSGLEDDEAQASRLARGPTIAIYGDDDLFTSSKKLRRWTSRLKQRPESSFQATEIPNAGHFWHSPEVQRTLANTVTLWAQSLLEP